MTDLSVDRERALAVLREYTENENLLKHGFGVEAAMRSYARHWNESEELYAVTGLLHDFDYERFPDPASGGHPYAGAKILRELGYPENIVEAILGHANFTGVERKTMLAKTLYAVDELVGLVTASVYVRPDRSVHTLEVSSVKKKFKDKAFSRGVNRDDIIRGAQELGIELDTHIGNVISALREAADLVGLAGTAHP